MSAAPFTSVFHGAEEPIRAELFSVERLEEHAESLAAAQTVTSNPRRGKRLTPRVQENASVLLECYRTLAQAIQLEQAVTPAAEWLVDNFHVVDEQIREIRDDLPVGFYKKLPKLRSGHLEGLPRVFGVAWAFVAHTDSSFDPEVLRRFVNAYQKIQALTIGELWALMITLRIVLVENLRRLADKMIRARAAREEADELADRLIGTGGQPPVKPEIALTELGSDPLAEAFAVRLLQRLRDLSPNVRPILLWLDQRLAEQGATADDVVRSEHQQQAAMNVTVRNIITSMRLMSAFDWHDFFESVSLVDRTLSSDTNFPKLNFATRDAYRHAIEDLSRGSAHSETEIAEMVVARVRQARSASRNGSDPDDDLRTDPGHYLISRGRFAFEREVGFSPSLRRRLLRLYVRAAVPGYLGTIAIITAAILALPLLHDRAAGASTFALVALGIFAVFPASDLAIALINRFVTDLLGPRPLPRLELKNTVPEYLRTIIVVPTLLTNATDVRQLVESLEVHFLANPEGCLHYALLSDWGDADAEKLPLDDELLEIAAKGVARLNRLYGPAPGGDLRFLLLHRRRVWNASEEKWMGWERKRGKLHELNAFLRGSRSTSFLPLDSSVFQPLRDVRFVVTLDSDTRVPPGAVYEMIGTIAHPLNRAEFASNCARVVEGYGVVQPRITPSLPTEHKGTIFQRIFSGPSGLDPYASAISDLYQDLFHEGTYTGKGIYSVDAFEQSLAEKVPENTLLSHDLFEGTFARTALVTDIELFDEYPSHYLASAARQHRWARGDWQLLPWILGRGYRHREGIKPSSLSAIGRWKMIDNLRRSLVPPATLITLIAGWMIPPGGAGVWTRFVLATIAIPALLPFLMSLNPRGRGISKRSYFRGLLSDLWIGSSQIGLTLTFLAYQAWLMCDAIIRTLYRLFVSQKRLLEWVTAAQAKGTLDLKLSSMYRRMVGSVFLVIAAAIILALGRHGALLAGAPFLALWIAAPLIARDISLPPVSVGAEAPTPADEKVLRQIARRTWLFFETFVTKEDNFLPPDNFQEAPKPVVAHRTSPTNIGLYLLSALSAYDFGWIGATEAIERIEATLQTIDELERFRGHLYNWYDTRTLKPLEPRYISSVDSGNLGGHLLTLVNGCKDLSDAIPTGKLALGLEDSLDLLRQALAAMVETRPTHIVTPKEISASIDAIYATLAQLRIPDADSGPILVDLASHSRVLSDNVQTFIRERGDPSDSDLKIWADAAARCVASHLRDAEAILPRERPQRAYVLHARSAVVGGSPQDDAASTEEQRTVNEYPALSPALEQRIAAIAGKAEELFQAMDFSFLFDESRKLFSIGYRSSGGTLDASCYDLLASEARLTSFIAIAKGDVPPSHWFRLGRQFTPVGRGSALISWSGSMFEYLMPALVMRSPAESMLSQTNQLIVDRQISYAAEHHAPWGISESAYNARDIDLAYQYSSFGVPGLGLKRGLSEDLVIAPYATALAAMIEPARATENFRSISRAGGRGTYGFYEALDYTKSRVPEGKNVAVVRAYMAHHQGMSLVSLANVLNSGIMHARFHSQPIVQASELLLQERTPRDVLVARPRAEEVTSAARVRDLMPPALRRFKTPHESLPRTQLLSNGRYTLMLTSAGSGYSRCDDIAVTRWREDSTRDCWGAYIYLRDVQSNEVWSVGYQPCGVEPDSYEATFYEDRAEIIRRDRSLLTTLEVVVSSEDDAEMRRVSISNTGTRTRNIQITSYAEISLTTQAADIAHPAFSKLFVETEFVEESGTLLATRRKQSDKEKTLWLAHLAAVEQGEADELEYETDRAQFVGRGNDVRRPISLTQGVPLSRSTGPVLDPIFSLRRTVRIPPGRTVRIVFSTMMASSREDALALADKYRDARIFERMLTLAWTQAQVQLHHLGIGPDEANLFQRLANFVLYPDASLRPSPDVLSRTNIDVTQLWAFGISGDLPIVLAVIDQSEDVDVVRQLLRAHEYWRMKQFAADLVIINEEAPSYEQELHGSLTALVRSTQLRVSSEPDDRRGGVFLLRADLVSPQTRQTLECIARAVLVGRRGALSDQITRVSYKPERQARRKPQREIQQESSDELASNLKLEFFNGLGGFADEGREYVIALGPGLRTPQPWINVVANASFGFITSESGVGYTWAVNSRENQLTPWSNDPVSDPAGEAIYIRDESSGDVWSATSLPVREPGILYIARHGQGYSRFEHVAHGIRHHLVQFVPPKDSIKVSRLTLRNESGRMRRLAVTSYAEWVLGNSRSGSAPFIVSERDSQTGALFARSMLSGEFSGRVAFADLAGRQQSWTADRREFLGRHGSPESPAALDHGSLSGKVGAALDPCAALQTSVELRPGAQIDLVVLLGQGNDANEARQLVATYRKADLDEILIEVAHQWSNTLNAVQVETPDPSANVLLNHWLLYQTLSCRIWGRTAFYQVSGAYGFRDQLQDVMALSVAKRDVAREHILRAAARQFLEGDVQHWWHPPSGRGVRTRISDDKLWLPYAVSHFVERTGDRTVLDENIPFLEGDSLAEGQTDAYFQPRVSEQYATLFEHCARAVDSSMAVGGHGLPLMGTGDWNDGMNRIGEQGKGESVWLGWFQHAVLSRFIRIANDRGEHERAQKWHLHASALKAALEREGWDGEWYRRAFYDDGTLLGSAINDECRVDSIAQSWAVISRAAEQNRSIEAMEEVYRQLVLTNEKLVLLFTPPFDHGSKDPGYIKGYLPGIRENGGQYTHGAVWNILAFAILGDGRRAWQLFEVLNPINHASSRAGVQEYRVEPYVMAGDVYANPAHVGRGGWTWYTGSSGWLYRVVVESILGFQMHGMSLCIDPCIPPEWPGFSMTFRYHSATYKIEIGNPSHVSRGVALTRIDGVLHVGVVDIHLFDDAKQHDILVVLG
jgi:cyclic beta-1,2-glucan synthetase